MTVAPSIHDSFAVNSLRCHARNTYAPKKDRYQGQGHCPCVSLRTAESGVAIPKIKNETNCEIATLHCRSARNDPFVPANSWSQRKQHLCTQER